MDKDEKVFIDRVTMFSQNQVYKIAHALSDSHSKEVRNVISVIHANACEYSHDKKLHLTTKGKCALLGFN